MSRLDVRELKHEKLSPGRFPGDVSSDFRLHMAAKVHQGITQHAKQDATVEICGVLVGGWETDAHGPYCVVSDLIRCEQAASKFAEVTFTHESWAQINKEMDTKFGDKRIVGWYHSHPDFGIFLSERDCFIHEHFFSGPGQVAFVTDPVRDLEGVFAWRNGKPELMPHFWIGETIRGAEASRLPVQGKAAERGAGATAVSAAPAAEASYLGLLTTVLAWLCLFLLGFLCAGQLQSGWDRQMVAEGMVANFAEFKVLHQGLEGDLTAVRDRIAGITDELKKLPVVDAAKEPEQANEVAEKRKELLGYLDACTEGLQVIEDKYGYSEQERAALARLIARKVAAMREPLPATKSTDGAAKDGKAVGESKDGAAGSGKSPAAKSDVPAGKAAPTTEQPKLPDEKAK